jgi:hypothetical protein
MPASIASENTTTPTLATDTTLVTQAGPTGGGCYVLHVDAVNLANGETLTLTLRTRARPGGTTRTAFSAPYQHTQSDPVKISPLIAVPSGSELIAVLRQDGGTARAFPWALIRIDA